MKATQQPLSELHLLLKALGYLRTHWWLFALEILVLYSFQLHKFHKTPPVYQSNASILIDHSRRDLYDRYILGPTTRSQKRNMVHLLTSQQVLKRFQTAFADYYNAEGRPNHLRNYFPGGQPLPEGEFRNWIGLDWNKDSDIYSVTCTANTPDAAAALCLIYMNTIQDFYPEIGQRESMMKREFLARQIASQTREITERENQLVEFQKQNSEFMDFLLEGGKEKLRSNLQVSVNRVKKDLDDNRALKDLLLSVPQAKRGEHNSLGTAITALTAQVSEIQYQIQLTQQSIDPEKEAKLHALNQELARVSNQLAKLNESEIQSFLKNPLTSQEVRERVKKLEFDYRLNSIKLKGLESELKEATRKAKKFTHQFFEHERMNSELNDRKKLLSELFRKEQKTELELSAGQAEIFRLAEPSRSNQRIAPQLSQYLYSALSVSLFVVAATMFILIALFPRIDSEAEINRLNLPVLGKVPTMSRHGIHAEEIPSFGLEHLKIMGYRIQRETKETKSPIIIISSPNAREGKSTVAHCLSIASLSPTRKTLLIDGDMLTLHPNKFLGIQEDQTPGVKAILEGNTEVSLSDLVVKTIVEGVSFLPRGGRMDPSSLPHSLTTFENALSEFRKQYDQILIDTPPLFASNLSHQWVGVAQLIILVARIYITRPKDITEAIQTCKIISKAPVGVALNCMPLSSSNRRASNYYFSRRKIDNSRLAA